MSRVFCIEAHGIEWDWFACDLAGHVALISSGGSGQVPRSLLAHEAEIQALLDHMGLRCDAESWRVAADLGIFGYDVDIRGGPFRRLTSPRRPRTIDGFSEPHRRLITRAMVRELFPKLRRIDCSLISGVD